jgi:hypothetical protein
VINLQPWETYTADTSIDLTRHHVPKTMLDKIAYWTVKSLRFPTDVFFQVRACVRQFIAFALQLIISSVFLAVLLYMAWHDV